MVEPVRHRQTKEAATDMFDLQPPRHISTLPKPASLRIKRKSASASCGHTCRIGLGSLVPTADHPPRLRRPRCAPARPRASIVDTRDMRSLQSSRPKKISSTHCRKDGELSISGIASPDNADPIDPARQPKNRLNAKPEYKSDNPLILSSVQPGQGGFDVLQASAKTVEST
jgi:hypothetical protein